MNANHPQPSMLAAAREFVSNPACAKPLAALRMGLASVLILQALSLSGDLDLLYGEVGVVQWNVMDAPGEGRPGFVILGVCVAAALLMTTHLGSISPAARKSRHDIESIEGTRDYALRRINEGKILADYIQAGVLPDAGGRRRQLPQQGGTAAETIFGQPA